MIITIVIAFIIAGLLLWVVDQLPIDATIKRLIHVVVIVVAVLWVLSVLFPGHLPKIG